MIGQEKQVALAPLVQPISSRANYSNYHEAIVNTLVERRVIFEDALTQFMERAASLAEVATRLVEALRTGHKILVAGNGGSAAEAQHFAAELVGRFKRERNPYAVLSLTTDTSILTAIANDYGYADVFARQIGAFGQPGDVFIAFSTSGSSENLVRAAKIAHSNLLAVVAITGDRPGRLEAIADMTLRVPHVETAIVQELHMVVTHILCDIMERELSTCEGELGE